MEGVPGLPSSPQDEAGLTRKFETSHVGGATGRTPRIPRSALEKDPRQQDPLEDGMGTYYRFLSCRDQEGRRGSEEAVPGPSVLPSREPRPARGAGTLIPSAQRLVWAAKQALGKAALGALFA